MSLVHLRTFMEAYRRRSLSEAARTLGLTQPAVSLQIAALEAHIGKPLFERHVRGVRPTAVADDLAVNVGSTLDVAEGALAATQARSNQFSGTVHLAAPAHYLCEHGTSYIASLIESGFDLRIHIVETDALYPMLVENKVDLAVTATEPNDQRLACRRVGIERLLAVAIPALADRILDAEDLGQALATERYVTFDLDRTLLRSWMTANNLDVPDHLPSVTVPDLAVLRSAVCHGLGWSVLPEYLTSRQRDLGELKEITPPVAWPENHLNLVWAKMSLRRPRIIMARDILLSAFNNG